MGKVPSIQVTLEYQGFTQVDGPARLRLVRKGSRYTMFAGNRARS